MARTHLALIAVFTMALTILLGGCGGGGGGGTSSGGGSNGSGKVLAISGTPVAGATVKFYGPASNTVLGTGTIASDGSLPATAPPAATRFSIDVSGLEDTTGSDLYWSTFSYGEATYYDDSTSCYAPLPQTGSTRGFTDNIVFYLRASSPPPPPPTGCVGL